MATQTRLSLDEYLQTSYHPDCEYIDGELQERNVGKWEHGRLQALLATWFYHYEKEWNVMGAIGPQTRVTETRVRIPDLVLVKREKQTDVLSVPPVLVVEILSPEDTDEVVQDRVADYHAMGVRSTWLIDTKTRTGRMCSGATWTDRKLMVPGTAIFVDLQELFYKLEESSR